MTDGINDRGEAQRTPGEPPPTPAACMSAPGSEGTHADASPHAADGVRPASSSESAANEPSGAWAGATHAEASGTVPEPTTSAPRPRRRLLQRLLQLLWMGERLSTARREGFAPGHAGWDSYALGRVVMADAQQLSEPLEGHTSALVLYRAAAGLMIRAWLARIGIEREPGVMTSECWARLEKHPSVERTVVNTTAEEHGLVERALCLPLESLMAGATKEERGRMVRALAKFASSLAGPLDLQAKSVRRVLWLRALRVTGLVLGLGLVITLPLAKAKAWTERPNLALGRPVAVVNTDPTYGVDPKALVDGQRDNLGFHTISAPNQHVTIDLGAERGIREVVVYNRTDCCEDRAVPLKLGLSVDGANYLYVAVREKPFMRWNVRLPGTQARYVRLTHLHAAPFHLAEVEVY